jgi:hypothetical protein
MAIVDYEHFAKETNGFLSGWFDILGDCFPQADGSGPFGYGRAARGFQFGRNLSPAINTFFVQFHFYLPSTASLDPPTTFLQLKNAAALDHVSFTMNFATRTIIMNYQTGSTTCTVGSFAYDSWNFLQVRVHIGNLDGAIQIWQNGVSIGSIANQDTENGGAFCHKWTLTSGDQILFANLLIYTESGNAPNARTPETRIYAVPPNGAGASADFTAVGAGANWQCQTDNPNDADTTYVSAASAPSSDLYAFPANSIAAGGIVYAVGVEIDARKDDAGSNEIDELIRSGGATFVAGSPSTLTSTYQRFRRYWDLDPNTSAAWTISNSNNAQVGFRRTT